MAKTGRGCYDSLKERSQRLRAAATLCPLSRAVCLQQISRSKSVSNNIRSRAPRGSAMQPSCRFQRMNPLLMTLRTTNAWLPYNKPRGLYVRLDLFIHRHSLYFVFCVRGFIVSRTSDFCEKRICQVFLQLTLIIFVCTMRIRIK